MVSAVNTICDRIKHALEVQNLSRRTAERGADFKRGELSTFLNRDTKKMREDRSRRLAKALGVRHQWLVEGVEPMSDKGQAPHLPPPAEPASTDKIAARAVERETCPTRAPVVAMLKVKGFDPGVIAAIQAEHHEAGDPGASNESYWWDRVTYYKKRLDELEALASSYEKGPEATS